MVKSGKTKSIEINICEQDNVKPAYQPSRVRKRVLRASVLETLLILLTIGLGFSIEDEVSRSVVALVTHVIFSTVTTGFVVWKKALPTRQTTKNKIKFWLSNVLFLTKPFSFWCRNETDIETKIKASYTRLLVSFFTIIPACFVQNYFLFQPGDKIYWHPRAFNLLRIATIATGLYNTVACVYEYDDLTIEYELKSKVEPTNTEEFRTSFRRYFSYICQRVTLTGYLASLSPYFALIYTISNFTTNYVVLKHMPQLENPYINPPHGTHSNASYWTFRIINIISGVGTRLNLDLKHKYFCSLLRDQCPNRTVWLVLAYHCVQFTFFIQYFTYNVLYYEVFWLKNPITFIVILCVYGVTVLGDYFMDVVSGESVFINIYKDAFQRYVIEPICDSRLRERVREWSTQA